MLRLRVMAPFAAFRPISAGSFRPTADFLTPSAAFGLLLNIAGVEMRGAEENSGGTTLIAKDLPPVRLVIGACSFPERQQIFQQLHNYPVGTSGKEKADLAKGSKYNIKPVSRAFLSDFDAIIAVEAPGLESDIRKGLLGKSCRRYGLPFLGDNSFLPDRLEEALESVVAHWYCTLDHTSSPLEKRRISRLTITINREDMTGTKSRLFAPLKDASAEIPKTAWVDVIY